MASKSAPKAEQPKKKTPAELTRERKINACLEQISQYEETINLMKLEQRGCLEASLLGLSVSHKQFGDGTVSSQDSSILTVQFGQERKRFAYPTAFFDGFLSTKEESVLQNMARYQEMEGQIQALRQSISETDRILHSLKK